MRSPTRHQKRECEYAFDRLECTCIRADIYLREINFKTKLARDGSLPWAEDFSPATLAANMMLPLFAAMIEDYFRSVFVALLQISEKKLSFLKSHRLDPEDLLLVSDYAMSVEEAVARTLSFQNMDAIARHFRGINGRLDIRLALDDPAGTKLNASKRLSEILQARHRFVHENIINQGYTLGLAATDCEIIRKGISQVHGHIQKVYRWRRSRRSVRTMQITRSLPADEIIQVGEDGPRADGLQANDEYQGPGDGS